MAAACLRAERAVCRAAAHGRLAPRRSAHTLLICSQPVTELGEPCACAAARGGLGPGGQARAHRPRLTSGRAGRGAPGVGRECAWGFPWGARLLLRTPAHQLAAALRRAARRRAAWWGSGRMPPWGTSPCRTPPRGHAELWLPPAPAAAAAAAAVLWQPWGGVGGALPWRRAGCGACIPWFCGRARVSCGQLPRAPPKRRWLPHTPGLAAAPAAAAGGAWAAGGRGGGVRVRSRVCARFCDRVWSGPVDCAVRLASGVGGSGLPCGRPPQPALPPMTWSAIAVNSIAE